MTPRGRIPNRILRAFNLFGYDQGRSSMTLKITLKSGEKMIVGGAVIANADHTACNLLVENNVSVLRQKDILGEKDIDSPCRRIYFTIQLMYIDEANRSVHQKIYMQLVRELVRAAPSTIGLVDAMNEEILAGRFYRALKLGRRLIQYEREAIRRVQQSTASL